MFLNTINLIGLIGLTGCYQSPAAIFKKRSTDYFKIEEVHALRLSPNQKLNRHSDYEIPKVKKSTPLTEADLLPPGICF